ncbi:MAG: type II toxin-antitoxin system HicB family antitoxin [Dehalococcoidia bacterium]|nr:type II toxin-antitoxin system HicB family antitoxin [Dehalococcoidia bacterium]
MKDFKYTIIIKEDEDGGYWTQVPALPGCGSQGDTLEEAVEMTKDAIRGYLLVLQEDGEPIPPDIKQVATVVVAA